MRPPWSWELRRRQRAVGGRVAVGAPGDSVGNVHLAIGKSGPTATGSRSWDLNSQGVKGVPGAEGFFGLTAD